jgi:hypothetical protein
MVLHPSTIMALIDELEEAEAALLQFAFTRKGLAHDGIFFCFYSGRV